MKVRIEFTVDVDEEVWAATYGITPDGVRADVRDAAYHWVTAQMEQNGLLGEKA